MASKEKVLEVFRTLWAKKASLPPEVKFRVEREGSWEEAKDEPEKIFVFARDYNAARLYASTHNIKPKQFVYVRDEDTLRGREDGITIHIVTTYSQHPRMYEILEMIDHLRKTRCAKIVEVEW